MENEDIEPRGGEFFREKRTLYQVAEDQVKRESVSISAKELLDYVAKRDLQAMKEPEGENKISLSESYFGDENGNFKPEPRNKMEVPDFEDMALEVYGSSCEKGHHHFGCRCKPYEEGALAIWKEHVEPLQQEIKTLRQQLEYYADKNQNQ
jgi:hypothetical protein